MLLLQETQVRSPAGELRSQVPMWYGKKINKKVEVKKRSDGQENEL